ncbi:MAG: hypothetical protein A2V67_14405 [Deltaproteobacteria bacterium RBG_13_61_14]|nr:MAG: hypothetical protein A2V67_14405 [Deltaproteobacteria bacterium RBG_13_61_14]
MSRRDLLRIEAKVDVEYQNFEQFFQEYTKNISLGGIFIKTEKMVPVQTVLEIGLKLPELAEPLTLVGEVVHAITPQMAKEHGWEPGLGIHFVDYDEEEAKTKLEQYVRNLTKKHPDKINDRRKSHRVPLRLRVKFPNLQTLMEDYAKDISQGGIFIQSENPRQLGDRFIVTMVHPDTKQELELEGEVVRVARREPRDPGSVSGMGIRFVDLDEKAKKAIELFLATDYPANR